MEEKIKTGLNNLYDLNDLNDLYENIYKTSWYAKTFSQ